MKGRGHFAEPATSRRNYQEECRRQERSVPLLLENGQKDEDKQEEREKKMGKQASLPIVIGEFPYHLQIRQLRLPNYCCFL